MDLSEKFCPTCKNKNNRESSICRYCGAPLDEYKISTATTKNAGVKLNYPEKPDDLQIDESIIPNEGITVYFAGTSKPIVTRTESEFIIGRRVTTTSEAMLDLSEFDGFKLGLSRRHAMIRQTKTGYEVIDLSSTNGTWLNDERLVPYTPHRLTNGAQLRLSRMRLFIFFRSVPEKTKEKDTKPKSSMEKS